VLHFVCVQIAVTVALITAAATTMAEKHQENQERSSIIAGEHSGIIHVSIKMWKSRGKQKRNDNKEIWLVKRLKLSFSFGFWLQKEMERVGKPSSSWFFVFSGSQ